LHIAAPGLQLGDGHLPQKSGQLGVFHNQSICGHFAADAPRKFKLVDLACQLSKSED